MLRDLADPKLAGALRCLHKDATRAWPVNEMAQVAGMSRPAFALRFVAVVGQTPMAYLGSWRMALSPSSAGTAE